MAGPKKVPPAKSTQGSDMKQRVAAVKSAGSYPAPKPKAKPQPVPMTRSVRVTMSPNVKPSTGIPMPRPKPAPTGRAGGNTRKVK